MSLLPKATAEDIQALYNHLQRYRDSMKESDVEKTIIKEAAIAGWLVRKVRFTGRRDAPDRLFARYGRLVFIEFKRPGDTPRTSQTREANLLRDAGLEVYFCDTIERGRKALELPTPA